MSVEYQASTMTNMDIDNSKVGYKQLLDDGSKLRYSVYALRNSPFRAATVGLGLLCVLLLAVVIGQSVHYQKVGQDHQNNLKAMTNEKEKLQDDLKTEKKLKKELETSRNQLQKTNDYLSKRRDQLQTNNNILTQEQQQLKSSQSQLQASNAAITKEKEQLKASKDQLQSSFTALSTAKASLQKQYDLVLKRKNEVQASFETVTKERDNLQNKFNNVSRSKDQLQLSYNDLIKRVEHLQDRYNFSTSEKDKLASSHQNLTISKETLQATYDLLVKETDKLRATYASLVQEKEELESDCKNATVDRDLLKVNNYNLTTERDQLKAEIERLKGLVPARKCPTGWKRFEQSCYFTSVSKKSWSQGRSYCQSNGADLAIIKSQDEMLFINGLYSTDKEVWIGLTDEGIEGQWKWVDGTTLTTAFWDKGQPNSYDGRNQDCVEFWHRATGTGAWNDENCDLEQNFICEM
ncbi:CD209 antigen-like isoform X1 [Epinephelus fuscoguttatus]|uniref:CD209 antigen-like isoform X1 n=2 Tax=Epinephelus fuscoguttatus TaxID=293821 RepID=UPI0020D052D6|nr:CD209 antigen-like isoform X1 [Epinephelus fuscoguttatus]